MEETSSHPSLLQLVNLNLLRNQSENGNIAGLIVAHAHWISFLMLHLSRLFLLLEDIHLLESLLVKSLFSVLLHLLTDLYQV